MLNGYAIVFGALLDWRWIFLVNLPIGVATLASAARRVPVLPRQRAARVPSPGQSALVIVAIAAASLAVAKGSASRSSRGHDFALADGGGFVLPCGF